MNKQERDILNNIYREPFINQRILAETSGYSLGVTNRSIKKLAAAGYLDEDIKPTKKAKKELFHKKPKNAIILAAGYGMRMVPINMEIPKGLIEVHGEVLIERLIRQLQEVGISEIYIVVGYMKEQYEYLMDMYGVELIVNMDYGTKNNIYSLKKAITHLSNSYIVPCDIWCDRNPFQQYELYSWYLVGEQVDNESSVRVNRKSELVSVHAKQGGNAMIGIAYLLEKEADIVRRNIIEMTKDHKHDNDFWEEALYKNGRMIVYAKVAHISEVVEINTYEQLRELDGHSSQLQNIAISEISKVLSVSTKEIRHIAVLKKGMTNRSFLFECNDQKYIMRIPGEGTDQLINRQEEAEVYHILKGKGICDDVIYINPENGYKITKYLTGARSCNSLNVEDVAQCMKKLREFHDQKLQVSHEFDIFAQIQYYEKLWAGKQSIYRDYYQTKERVLKLKEYIEAQPKKYVLTHIDAVPDNFLFTIEADGKQTVHLIDWEYAGMQDPHVDLAMFCIYALYNRQQVDKLLSLYFEEGCSQKVRVKIYCYIAVCGLLWSNWCEYKRNLGIEFGEYALRQYRYAKDYYQIVQKELKKMEEERDA